MGSPIEVGQDQQAETATVLLIDVSGELIREWTVDTTYAPLPWYRFDGVTYDLDRYSRQTARGTGTRYLVRVRPRTTPG